MKLHELSPASGSTKERKRIGRGPASGQGKTAGKGHKGQKARAGRGMRAGFEGGQMPLQRRIPKRGFNNIFARKIAIVNVSDLSKAFNDGDTVDVAALIAAGLVKKENDGVKILGNGEIDKKLTVRLKEYSYPAQLKKNGKEAEEAEKPKPYSQSAKEKIEAAGGKVEVI